MSAPFDGIVTRHLVDVGALVGYSGPTKLATIIQVDPIYVYFNASETVVLRIKEALAKQGKTFKDVQAIPVEVGLQTEDGYPHKGHIDYIAPNVDPSTGTLQVRAVFDNKDVALLPGLFVRVRVPVQKFDNSLLVADPRSAPISSASICWCRQGRCGRAAPSDRRPARRRPPGHRVRHQARRLGDHRGHPSAPSPAIRYRRRR